MSQFENDKTGAEIITPIQGGNMQTIDTKSIGAIIGMVCIGIAFLFVVIAPAFPQLVVPQGTVNAVFGFFGAAFGYLVNAASQQAGVTATIKAMTAPKQ